MKRIIFLCLFTFSFGFLHAQYALIKINIQDCAKCLMIMESILSENHNGFPRFIVFPNYEDEDKRKIYEGLGDTSNLKVPILFSNQLYERLATEPFSGLYYLNHQNKIVFGKRIDQLQKHDIDLIDSMYQHDYFLKLKRNTHLTKIVDSEIYEYNIQLNDIQGRGLDNFKISLTSNLEKNIIDSVNTHFSGFYDLTRIDQSLSKMHHLFYKMHASYFDVYDQFVFQTVSFGYMKYIGKDSTNLVQKVKDDDSLVIDNLMVLLKFDKGNLKNVYPCRDLYDDSSDGRFGNLVKVANDSTFILYYGPYKSVMDVLEKGHTHKLLAEYVLRDGILQFKKQLNLDVPENYKDNDMKTSDFSLSALQYPYLAPQYSNQIFDLQNEKTYTLEHLFNKDASQFINLSASFADSSKRGKVIRNDRLYYDNKKQKIYLASRIAQDGFYLSIIDKEKMKEIQALKFASLQIPFSKSDYPFIHIDTQNDLIFLEDENQLVRVYPLELLLNL